MNSNKKILIFSNCAASKTESNGRIHMTHFRMFNNIHNFYLTGSPDCEWVNYLSVSYKDSVLSKLSFGLFKPSLRTIKNFQTVGSSNKRKNNKKPFIHWLRNFCFRNNKSILNRLVDYVKKNNIEYFVLWGCNVPFLYEYVYKLSKTTDTPFITITSEDYPLKTYNYLNNKKSFFFNSVQKQLKKYCANCYKNSCHNIYTNEELKLLYENKIECDGGKVIYFGSDLKPCYERKKELKTILYGGKLYDERIQSLLDIADALKDIDGITINIYGAISDQQRSKLIEYPNVIFYGLVDYDILVKEIYQSDVLLHVEGFSDYYVKDCLYAFSTKIADYLMTLKPFIVYGNEKISGVKFYSQIQPRWCFTSKAQLKQLIPLLLSGDFKPVILTDSFSSDEVSLKIKNLIDER